MKNPSIPIPTREGTSNNQLSALLAITQALQPYLILYPQDVAGNPPHPSLDGGTVSAASATFIRTCAKLDDLLNDASRWSLDNQDALYASLIETQKHQQAFIDAQTLAAQAVASPAFLFKPVLVVLDNGYAACYGDLTSPGSIVGFGVTPEAAFEDFNAAWKRQAAEQNAILPATEETPVAPAPEKKNTKRKKK